MQDSSVVFYGACQTVQLGKEPGGAREIKRRFSQRLTSFPSTNEPFQWTELKVAQLQIIFVSNNYESILKYKFF